MFHRYQKPNGFTLVEVVTSLSIGAMLVGLLLPALQHARESARELKCQSNLRQISLANHAYAAAYGSYVLGRDGIEQWSVAWSFRLLPHLEYQSAYDAHHAALKCSDDRNSQSMRIAVAEYACPTRREPATDRDFDDNSKRPVVVTAGTRGDYAGNAGQVWLPEEIYAWDHSNPALAKLGPVLTMRTIGPRHVTGGTSSTWFVGERHIPALPTSFHNRHYRTGDMAFLSGDHPWTVLGVSEDGLTTDREDRGITKFGSLHRGGVYFTFLDGHVEARTTDTDQRILDSEASIGAL